MSANANVKISAGGKDLSRDLASTLISVESNYQAHGIPEATVRIREPALAQAKFTAADLPQLAPGKPIVIKLVRLDAKADEGAIFAGLITGQTLRIEAGRAELILQCHSALISLVEPRQTKVFKKDSDDAKVLKALLGPSKVKATIDGAKFKHEQLAMVEQHPWEFIKYRAEANGLLIIPSVDKKGKEQIAIQPSGKYAGATAAVKVGLEPVLAVNLSTDATNALDQLKTAGWDPAKQANTPPQASAVKASGMKVAKAPFSGAKAFQAMQRKGAWQPVSGSALAPEQLKAWAASELMYRELDRYKGEITFPGRHDLVPGGKIKLEKLAKVFNGTFLITGVRHQMGPGDWTTTVQIGLPITRTSFFNGLHRQHQPLRQILVGKALGYAKADEGKAKLNRIQVQVPALGDAKIWARLASPYASKDASFFFPPAKGDELVLGWLDGNASEPVVLTALYNAANKPPEKYHDENMKRALLFSKEDKLEYDKKGKKFSLAAWKHQLELADKKLDLTAKGELGFVTDKAMKLKPDGGMAIETGKNVEIKATKVEIK